jgi:pimeloyl-ACP methyl ester carboxylesterase
MPAAARLGERASGAPRLGERASGAPRRTAAVRRRRRAGLVAGVVALVLAVSACTAPAPQPTASGGDSITWTACGDHLECTRVPVPLDWAHPNGKTISLAVIKHPASDPARRIGTLFVNPGGPGESGVALVRGSGAELDAWGGGRFDVVSWDPRGTGASYSVKCFSTEKQAATFWAGARIPSTDAESDAYTTRMESLAKHCASAMGPLLAHISTTDTVRDLDRLRSLVGDKTLTYVGLSYGTLIGQIYANLFPDRVRAMVLDGVVDPVSYMKSAEQRVLGGVAPTDEVFEKFLALCDAAGPQHCALAGHGETAAARVDALFEKARNGGITAADGDPAATLEYSDLLVSAFSPLRTPAEWGRYATELEDAVEGNTAPLAKAAAQLRTAASWEGVTRSSAISCLDAPAAQPVQDWSAVIGELTEKSRIAGAVQGWWLWAPCAAGWPASSDDRYDGPWNATTPNPVLVIGTRYDPNTAYANAMSVSKRLGNAVLLTHDGYGHLSYQDQSACVDAARTAYLVSLTTPKPETVCPADGRPFAAG